LRQWRLDVPGQAGLRRTDPDADPDTYAVREFMPDPRPIRGDGWWQVREWRLAAARHGRAHADSDACRMSDAGSVRGAGRWHVREWGMAAARDADQVGDDCTDAAPDADARAEPVSGADAHADSAAFGVGGHDDVGCDHGICVNDSSDGNARDATRIDVVCDARNDIRNARKMRGPRSVCRDRRRGPLR
jgi:hypothetical protein